MFLHIFLSKILPLIFCNLERRTNLFLSNYLLLFPILKWSKIRFLLRTKFQYNRVCIGMFQQLRLIYLTYLLALIRHSQEKRRLTFFFCKTKSHLKYSKKVTFKLEYIFLKKRTHYLTKYWSVGKKVALIIKISTFDKAIKKCSLSIRALSPYRLNCSSNNFMLIGYSVRGYSTFGRVWNKLTPAPYFILIKFIILNNLKIK